VALEETYHATNVPQLATVHVRPSRRGTSSYDSGSSVVRSDAGAPAFGGVVP